MQELFKTDAELGLCGLNIAERPLPWRIIKGLFIEQNDLFILNELSQLESWTQRIFDQAIAVESAPDLRALLERQAFESRRVCEHINHHRVRLLLAEKSRNEAPRHLDGRHYSNLPPRRQRKEAKHEAHEDIDLTR